MTDGEKMVWAAVYAVGYNEAINPPPEIAALLGGPGYISREEHENQGVHAAIEAASYAVESMREAAPEIKEGFDCDGCDVYKMLKEILEDK